MVRIESNYDGKCCKCGTHYSRGSKIGYDATAVRGKKAYCLNCAGSRLFTPDATAQEIAQLKQQLDEEHGVVPEPTAKQVENVAKGRHADFTVIGQQVQDTLAIAIAAAVEPLIRGKLDESRVVELIAEHTKPAAHTITVVSPECPEGRDMGRQHKQFEELLTVISARTHVGGRLNVWITGPAGTGKTTACENIAKALGLKFCTMPTQTDCYGFFGFMSPGTGQYQRTPARDIWENGGVLILDDFDGTPADVAIQLNAPFANGYCTFPDGVIPRHADCVIVLTANTWGMGGTNDYCGRLKQDAAFLNRFVMVDWEIDEQLELDTCPIRHWAERVQQVRKNVQKRGIKVLVTPRASYYGAALMQAGLAQPRVEAMTLRGAMSKEQWESVC